MAEAKKGGNTKGPATTTKAGTASKQAPNPKDKGKTQGANNPHDAGKGGKTDTLLLMAGNAGGDKDSGTNIPSRAVSAKTTQQTGNKRDALQSPQRADNTAGNEARFTKRDPPRMTIRQQITSQTDIPMSMKAEVLKTKPPDLQRALVVEPKDPTPPPSEGGEGDEGGSTVKGGKRRRRRGSSTWERRRQNGYPQDFGPCLHRSFKRPVPTRDSLSRRQYINMLSRPKSHTWEATAHKDDNKYKFQCCRPSKRLLALALPNKRQLRDSLRENYCVLAPTRIQRLVDTLQEEMFISKNGYAVNVDFADACEAHNQTRTVLLPPKKERLIMPMTVRKQLLLWEPEKQRTKCAKECGCTRNCEGHKLRDKKNKEALEKRKQKTKVKK